MTLSKRKTLGLIFLVITVYHSAVNRNTTALLLFIIVAVLFWPASHFDFINFDDPLYVYSNNHILGGLNRDNIVWAFSGSYGGHWHPLSWMFHMLNAGLFGIDPSYHHIVNILIHSANTVLFFLLLNRVLRDTPTAALLALVFGVHPMRLESVVWVSELKDVLSMFLGLLAIHAYLLTVRGRRGALAVFYAAFILSLLAKPTFMTLPALLLALDFWPLRRLEWKRVEEKFPAFFISLSIGAVATASQRADGALKSLSAIPLSDRFSNVWMGYITYISKLVLPLQTGIFYPFRAIELAVGIAACIGVAAVTWYCSSLKERRPEITFAWAWYLIALVPVIGFLPIGGQAYADRWSYLPHIGLLLAVGSLLAQRSQTTARTVAAMLACFYISLFRIQLPFWQNSITLFSHTLEVSPENFMAHTNLGTAYDREGNYALARHHFEEAYRLNPEYPEAINNFARFMATDGDMVGAQKLFLKAVEASPSLITARYNLGLAYNHLRNLNDALTTWIELLARSPGHSDSMASIQYMINNQRSDLCEGLRSSPQTAASILQWRPSNGEAALHDELIKLVKECR